MNEELVEREVYKNKKDRLRFEPWIKKVMVVVFKDTFRWKSSAQSISSWKNNWRPNSFSTANRKRETLIAIVVKLYDYIGVSP